MSFTLFSMKHINLNLPDELHTKFKVACASQGKKMTEVLQAAVDKYLQEFAVKVEKKKAK
jgi:metal-responsive CopG/Arc/MetJ family transcriptional regulator